MDASILCQLVAKEIDPTKFQLHGTNIYFLNESDNTQENQNIISNIITDYSNLETQYLINEGWKTIREKRDKLLLESDWTRLDDNQLTTEQKSVWAIYRQNLRDIPSNYATPDVVVWPTKPE
jgi:beta-galactosidase beta subunit